MSCRCSSSQDHATVKLTGNAWEDHCIQAKLSKRCSLALPLFQLQIEPDGHLLDCLPLLLGPWYRGHLVPEPHSPVTVDWSKGGPLTLGMWNRDWEPIQPLKWHRNMFSSCGHISLSGLGSRQNYLSMREEKLEWRYRGLVAIDGGGELPGLLCYRPTLRSRAASLS